MTNGKSQQRRGMGYRGHSHPDGLHSGQWRPGQSGNPSGRPKKTPEMRDLEQRCRESAEAALALLVDTINDPDAPRRDRLAAARELLDRGFGKPVDRQAVLNLNAGGDKAEELSREVLERIAAGALDSPAAQVLDFKGKAPPHRD